MKEEGKFSESSGLSAEPEVLLHTTDIFYRCISRLIFGRSGFVSRGCTGTVLKEEHKTQVKSFKTLSSFG